MQEIKQQNIKPKVSIIIPIYNVEKYLRQCLNSVVNQTLKDIEIICIDDGSIDNSGKIVDEYAMKYASIIPIHKQNGGYASAINAGLSIAKGDYIGIIESDDFVDLRMFELLFNKITEKDADVAVCDFYFIDDSINYRLRRLNYASNVKFDKNGYFNLQTSPSIIHKPAYPWKNLYKKSFLDKNNIKMKEDNFGAYQDQPWNAEILAQAQKMVHIKEPLYYYRLDADGSSTNIGKRSMINYLKRRSQARNILIEKNAFTPDVREYFYLSAYYGCEFFFTRIADEFKEEYFNEMKIIMNKAIEDNISFKFFPILIKKDYFRRLSHSYLKYKIVSKIRKHFSFDKLEKHYKINLMGIKISIKNNKKIISIYNHPNGKHKTFKFFGIKINIRKLYMYEFLSFVFDKILPKSEKKIIFNSFPSINDNPYWLYKYINENYPEYRCYWVTNGEKNETQFLPSNTGKLFSLKSLFHICTSKYIISNHCNQFIDMIHSKRHIWLNLWHGMPIKTLAYCEKNVPEVIIKRYKKISDNSYQFVTSDLFKTIVLSCFKSDYKKCFITGCPRTDSIFSNENNYKINKCLELEKYKKIIMYAPTYKEFSRDKNIRDIKSKFNNIFYANDYNHEEFIKFLEDNEILFIIKPHPFDENFYKKNVEPKYSKTNNVKFLYNQNLNNENIYLYEIFKFVDLMISDFSSITLDYLILNKPIIYLNNLDDEYKTNRGFILEDNYQIFMPGDKVSGYYQLIAAITSNLTKDYNKTQRQAILPLIHKYCDSNAAERIFGIMKGLK